MGKKRISTKYRLVWPETPEGEEEGPLDGLTVTMKGLSVRKLLDVQALASGGLRGEEGRIRPEAIDALFEAVAEHLVDWNLEEEDGTPVPTDLDGVTSLEVGPLMEIISEWIDAIAGVSPPLTSNSDGGQPSEEASIPMEIGS